jgi:glycogen debranching enzyme GlgX/4-alpha-glucanotransferase
VVSRVKEGSPEPLGVTLDVQGANVAVFSAHASAIELCLFDASGQTEIERIPLPFRTGAVFHAHVAGMAPGQRYGLRAHGPYAPGEGHRFNPHKLLTDPYALALDRAFSLHPSMFGFRRGGNDADLTFDDADSGPFAPKAIAVRPPSKGAGRIRTPWSDTVIYELHARGMTMALPDIPAAVRGTFAALACPAVLEHLASLGVTTLEIMPAAAWIDEPHLAAAGLANYWGYNPVALMAPDPRLAPGGWKEIRETVATLQEAGFEVIVDVVLNHSGEGDPLGPTLSLRGLDNAAYYLLIPDDPRRYVNDTGCGNTLALNRPPVTRLAMDALRAWALFGGVDGFRFDLATALGRRADGFDPAAPLLSAISQDPLLNRLKLIAEPWDIGPGGYRLGGFPAAWGEWNDRFRDGMRRFWRGDGGLLGEAATRFTGSSDVFGPRGRPSRSVNFITAHDGFSLADLVSYERKHNEANREHNRDGTNDNHSWNNGAEGQSADPAILAARRRDQRCLLATLMLARGAPMLAMGSEAGQSQGGNNNAYCQDNPMSWFDWDGADDALSEFVAGLIRLRKSCPALRRDRFLKGEPLDGSLIPDIEWRTAEGRPMEPGDWGDPARRTLIAAFYAPAETEREAVRDADRVLVILHPGREPVRAALPQPRDGRRWRVRLDTSSETPFQPKDGITAEQSFAEVAPRSVMLLSEVGDAAARKPPASSDLLGRLARAAGISPVWHDLSGRRHVAPDETKRALLAGMGLPAATAGEARDSLARLAAEQDRRVLPLALAAHKCEPVRLRIALPDGRRPMAVVIRREGGGADAIRLGPDDLEFGHFTAADRRKGLFAVATLPPQPAGRHSLALEHAPDQRCRLTVAPRQCFLPRPASLRRRAFGVSAQLYALRRVGDQGIGDFTTLAELAETASQRGAATIGVNPLHMLFPFDRERASPYYPSDRRFIDPIYLDLGAVARMTGDPAANAALSGREGLFARLSEAGAVDYPAVWAAKSAVLEQAFAAFQGLRARRPDAPAAIAFARFAAEGGAALRRFACFQAISEARQGQPWTQWPPELAQAEDAAVEAFAARNAARVDYHVYLQWLCDAQLARAAERARASGLAPGLYRDLAVGAAPDGAEAWANASQLLRGASIGAPPDPLAEGGQDWGLPPPDPLALRRTGCAAFGELLAANMRHAGALRIDHVMGLTRLFVIPHGAKALEGAYLSYPADGLFGELALESRRARCLVVGEDLGTAPEGLRERLAAANVLSYRVLWFERTHDGDGFAPPASYPAKSMACASTHDLPTLAGWWAGEDVAEKEALGLISADDAAAARIAREMDKRRLLRALHMEGRPIDGPLDMSVAAAVHGFVGAAASLLAMTQIEDLAGELTAANLPGTDRQRPNWRRKLKADAPSIFASDWAAAALRELARAGKKPCR